MCFVISMLGLFFAFNFFMAGEYLLSVGAVLTSVFFITLMIRNILHVKKLREEKNDDN
jgi:hypothetical protein